MAMMIGEEGKKSIVMIRAKTLQFEALGNEREQALCFYEKVHINHVRDIARKGQNRHALAKRS